MSAFAFENANKTWQRVNIALANASPAVRAQFKALKQWLSTQKGNPDLQFIPISGSSAAGASGTVLATGAARLVAVYGKKTNTATDDYLSIFDDATDDSGGQTDQRVSIPFLEANEENVFISPNGVNLAAGAVAKTYTTAGGTTDPTGTDCPNGFAIFKNA